MGLLTIGIKRMENSPLFDRGLSGTVIFSIALIMANSSILLTLFSICNRRNQILLLRKIEIFDRRMHQKLDFSIDWRTHRINFIWYMFVFIFYEILLFITQVIFNYYDDTYLLLFFAFYSVSDIFFAAHTAYVTFYGSYLINRYGALNEQLKIISNVTRAPMARRFSMLTSLYDKLFQLQLLVMECFGSILLFTIVFHVIAITASVYVLINNISSESNRVDYYFVIYVSWMLPYYVRICQIATVFASVTSQVLQKYCSYVFKYYILFESQRGPRTYSSLQLDIHFILNNQIYSEIQKNEI